MRSIDLPMSLGYLRAHHMPAGPHQCDCAVTASSFVSILDTTSNHSPVDSGPLGLSKLYPVGSRDAL